MNRRLLVALAAVVTAAAGVLPAGAVHAAPASSPAGPVASCGASAPTGATSRQIVRLQPQADPAVVTAELDRCGARTVAVQGSLGLLVADVPADRLAAVRGLPGVALVTADYQIQAQSLGFDPAAYAGSMTNVTRVSGATSMWQKGWTGAGVDVAVIDTGIAPVSGLKDAAKVVVGPDLSFESQDVDLRYLDTFGHGTHLSGIIAGRETAKSTGPTYAADTTNYYGMAPDARLVSLKLADHDGAVDISQVIAAVDWVVQNRLTGGLNIKVLNLSYGTHSPQTPQADPLSWAAEVAWKSGIVVVASAGNDGDTRPGLTNPAYNPWVIAVGAADTKGTATLADDTVPSFSARQGGNFINRGIDLVAPGVGIVSSGVPGSYIYESYPSARVGNGFIRGSGTSQAAAVVSGAAALLLSQRSYLSPDHVKALLLNGATDLVGVPVTAQGNGELNLVASSALGLPTNLQRPVNGSGNGGLESARGGIHVVMDGWELADERDIMGNSWVGQDTATKAHLKLSWDCLGNFNGTTWLGTGFAADTTSWAGKTWGGKTWTGKTWGGKTWTGKTWGGKTWSNAVWTGSGWSAANWSDPVSSNTWAGAAWSTEYWG